MIGAGSFYLDLGLAHEWRAICNKRQGYEQAGIQRKLFFLICVKIRIYLKKRNLKGTGNTALQGLPLVPESDSTTIKQ
jgi:hypothetical protein